MVAPHSTPVASRGKRRGAVLSWEPMAAPQIDRLLFVYNADSGRWNALLDSARKALAASACELCDLTHGLTGERAAWREVARSLARPIAYVHRDERSPEVAALTDGRLPCVVAESGGSPSLLVTREEIAACRGDLDDFGRLLAERVNGER